MGELNSSMETKYDQTSLFNLYTNKAAQLSEKEFNAGKQEDKAAASQEIETIKAAYHIVELHLNNIHNDEQKRKQVETKEKIKDFEKKLQELDVERARAEAELAKIKAELTKVQEERDQLKVQPLQRNQVLDNMARVTNGAHASGQGTHNLKSSTSK